MTERADIERLRRLLKRHRLFFVKVGGRIGQDKVIDTMIDQVVMGRYGGTINNPEYTALLRDIVRTVRRQSS